MFEELTAIPAWKSEEGNVACVIALLVDEGNETHYETRLLFNGVQFCSRLHRTGQAAREDAEWLKAGIGESESR